MKKLSLVAATCLVTVLASCGPEPEATEQGAQPIAAEAIAAYETTKKLYGYVKMVEGFLMSHIGKTPEQALREELDILHHQIARLEEEIKQNAQFVYRSALDGKRSDVAILRGSLKSALDLSAMGRFDSAEGLAAAPANTLSETWQLFELETADPRNKKFDPRIATPTFIEAVTAWLAIRVSSGRGLDATSRANLLRYAQRLEDISGRLAGSTTCRRSCSVRTVREPLPSCFRRTLGPDEEPDPDQCTREKLQMYSDVYCANAVSGESTFDLRVDRLADFCPLDPYYQDPDSWSESLPGLAAQKAEQWFPLAAYREMVAAWRGLANR